MINTEELQKEFRALNNPSIEKQIKESYKKCNIINITSESLEKYIGDIIKEINTSTLSPICNISDPHEIINSLSNTNVDNSKKDLDKSYSELYNENIELKKEVKQLKDIVEILDQYKYYYNACFAGSENPESDTAYYDNIKELFDVYAFEDSSKLSNDAMELKNQLLFLIPYFVYKLRNDEFYGTIIRHILSNSSDYFTNNLNDYKKLSQLMKSIINLDNHKLLKNIIDEGDKITNEKHD